MYRILVCDGEKEIVSSLTACLTAEGYQVVTARTGWEVLNILSKQHIHLALLGTKLPGLDGLTTVTRLRDVSFDVQEGEFCSIVGPSGCGKSTLLSALAGLEPLTGGWVELKGEPVCGPSRKVGFMPQRDQLFEWRSIWGNVTLGLTVRGENTPQRQAHVRELLERYGLADFAQKRPSQLSGGMRQRCALIRTLAAQPKVLLLDEPFSALDYQTRLAVSADIYRIIRQEGKTALLVTHDISEAISLSDRVVVLSHRPAVVKSIHRLTQLQGVPPLQRRDHPAFAGYFKSIWKELEVHEG